MIRITINEGLTLYEASNGNRFPYLWANFSRKQYNPFNKGWWINLKEIVISFVNPEIFIQNNDEEDEGDILEEIIDESNEIKTRNKDFRGSNQVSSTIGKSFNNNAMIMSEDGSSFYKPYSKNSKEIINWTRYRIYTPLDLLESPLRPILLVHLHNNC